ncbi:MAG: DUF3047 domain-containing protein [Candidatus Methylomirabilia bacterium]
MSRRRSGTGGLAVFAILVVLAVIAVMLASPRHRQFYGRFLSPPDPHSAGRLGRSAPPPPSRDQGLSPQAPTAAVESAAVGGVPGQTARGPDGRVGRELAVKVLATPWTRLPSREIPPAWNLKEFVGPARVQVVQEESRVAFRLGSVQTSFALYQDVIVNLKQFPILTWWWKVTRLPTGGDVRELSRDDQAAQIYLVFVRWPSPRTESSVMGYVWDSVAPVGLKLTSPKASNVKLVVLRSGAAELGRWVREERNVYQDYVELFGGEPPRIGMVAVMIDSDDTRSQAEAYVDDLVFLRARQSRAALREASGQ